MFGQANITPEQEEQLNWILDENFSILVNAIASRRNLNKDRVRELIDSAPFTAQKALEVGIVRSFSLRG